MRYLRPSASRMRRVRALYVGATPENNANQSSYSWTGVSLMGPGLYAFVVQGSGTNGTSAVARALSSLTVGGVGASIIAATNPSAINVAAIAYYRVTGSGTVALAAAFSGTMGRCIVNIYKIVGNKNDSPVAANAVSGTALLSLSLTLSVPRGAAAIFGSMLSGGPSVSLNWTGAKENYDVASSAELWTCSGARISPNNGRPSRTVTASPNVASDFCLSGASWK